MYYIRTKMRNEIKNWEIYDERTGIVVGEIVASTHGVGRRMYYYLTSHGVKLWGYFAAKVVGDDLAEFGRKK